MKHIFFAFIKNFIAVLIVVFLSALFVGAQESVTTTKSAETVLQPSPSPAINVPVPQTEPPTTIVEPSIDGKLDDAVWQNAAVFGDFVQISPGENVKPTHPTEFMMGYDAKNLYMAFRIVQDKNTVRATLSRRDNIFNDDYVWCISILLTTSDRRICYFSVRSEYKPTERLPRDAARITASTL